MSPPTRTTIRTLRQRARTGERFAMLTCYDATTARWLTRGGIDCLLVGDTASQMMLGHETTLPVEMGFMLEITAAVRRGAPEAFIMADMPFGSYQCGEDEAMANAAAFLKRGRVDGVKLECDEAQGALVKRMTEAGIPVVAHLGARPQQVNREGGYRRVGKTMLERNRLIEQAELFLQSGAVMLLLEACTDEATAAVVGLASDPPTGSGPVPVIGCGAGPQCHGEVLVLHDLLGLSDWQPPFAPPVTNMGEQISQVAREFVQRVGQGARTGPQAGA